ncbi:MAG: asparagine synthase (glutamine-hydrolyzing) [Chitinispirillaceae bacterium]|nr:asparagine synthase (glutamine-hydrolyzing) [Chitinispirillaceae bacterium]
MCGIAGIVDCLGRGIDPSLLLSMGRTIAHRGPDDEGYLLTSPRGEKNAAFSGPASDPAMAASLPDIRNAGRLDGCSIGFVHRRFSIIDLSSAGHQPFIAPEGAWAITYNGEVYNYRELRRELEASGFTFVSDCDTEVVLYAYMKWGTECFNRFNGFWALAIYDPRRESVLLSRDRLGVKPLYYAEINGQVAFASEIKALRVVPGIAQRAQPDHAMIRDWLHAGMKDHTEATFYQGINSFPAASWAFIGPGIRARTRTFWTLPLKRRSVREMPVGKAVAGLRELLADAINLRLRADVPLAVSLSGGIDSSALVAVARRDLCVTLPSFTVRFSDPASDESMFARAVTDACGSPQEWIDAPASSLWPDIAAFTALHDEPYHSPNLHVDQHVWSAMRARGIKVALNGAAGDENFGGYGYHYSLMQLDRLKKADLAGYVREAARCSDADSRMEAFLKPIAYAVKERLLHGGVRSLDLDSRLWQDMCRTQMPYWLVAGDHSYMGLPIEIREPFLDYRIVEFAFSLPLDYLVRDGWQKWIVRKMVEPFLPPQVVWRKRKMGFPFPHDRFFKESDGIIRHIIRSSSSPFINRLPAKRWRTEWMLLSYLLWHEWCIVRNTALFDAISGEGSKDTAWPMTPAYLAAAAIGE